MSIMSATKISQTHTMEPTTIPTTLDTTRLPLSFFQSGPLRNILEMEFELCVLDLAGMEDNITKGEEYALHEIVVPELFFQLLEHEDWLAGGQMEAAISLQIQRWIQAHLRSSIPIALRRIREA